MNTTVTCTCANGRPLEELGRLIDKRVQVLKQSVDKVVTAVAITTIKSLRAATNKAKGKIHPIVETINGELQVAVSECTDLCPAWTNQGGRRVPCIRYGTAKGTRTNI